MAEKEVFFDQYCPKCEYEKRGEHEPPCDDCLNVMHRWDSHKPEEFKEAKK